MNDKVTVIIPTFNRALFISGALRSIQGQTLSPFQIIVVDDGSTDGTRDIVEKNFPAVEYVRKDNGGKASAINFGMQRVKGDLVWVFDDDDLAERRALQRMVEALHDPHFGFAYGSHIRWWGPDVPPETKPDLIPEPYTDHSINVFGIAKALMFDNFIMHPALLVRKSCYDEVGLANEHFVRSQDYEMMLRLARRFSGVRVPHNLFYQRQHNGLRGTNALPIKADAMKAGWQFFDKKLFSSLYQTTPLSFFKDAAGDPGHMTTNETITALVVRGSIMAKKHLWELAVSDLGKAFRLAHETGRPSLSILEKQALRQVFAFNNLEPGAVSDQPEFIAVVSGIANPSLRREVRTALLYPAPYVFRSKLEEQSFGEMARISRAYLKVGGLRSAMNALKERLQDKRARIAF